MPERCTVPDNHRGLRGYAPGACDICAEIRAEAEAAMREPRPVGETLHPALPGRRVRGINDHLAREEHYLYPPTPEARCPRCGGGATLMSLHYSCNDDDCHDGIRMVYRPHQVWRRWGDTDRAEGSYWVDGLRGPHTTPRASTSSFPDTFWVLGPIPQPEAPK